MTYNSTISADAPVSWFHLEETGALSTSTAIADAGSAGGTGTAAGTPSRITTGQAGAGTIGGNSMKWDNASSTYLQHAVTFASAADFTMETWYKRDTGYGATVNTGSFLYMNGGNKNCQIAVNNNNIVITQNGSTVINAVPAGVTVMDGSWHHLAVVQSGTTITVYVDGVSKLTYSGANASANTSATWQVGSIGTAQTCWLDEPAFYTKALTSTQVSNHYTVGTATPSTPVTVTPPYINLGTLTEVAPAFAGGPDVKALPPVMSLNNLTVPAPVVSESSDATATPPVMTLSVSTPVPVVLAPFVNFGITSDRGTAAGSNTATTVQLALSSGNNTVSFEASGFTTAGNAVDTARLCLYATSAGTTNFMVAQIGAAWDDTTSGDTTTTGPNLTTQLHITAGWNYIDITPIAKNWAAGQPNYGVQLTAYTSGSATFSTRESTTNKPYISLSTVAPQVVTSTPPVMTASLATADPAVTAGVGALVQPTVASLTADVIAPAVTAGVSVFNAIPVATLALDFPGGIEKNPDYATTTTVMTLNLSEPNVVVSIQYPVTAQATYINVGGIYTSPGTVDLTTNVLKAVPAMSLTINWPGIYFESGDRYLTKVNSTVDQYARWFKLDEGSGTHAADAAFLASNGAYADAATLVGAIGFRVDGPYLRKAMHFNGVDSYADTSGGWSAPVTGGAASTPFYGTKTNIEFSIRTTATDGTIFAGGGGGTSGFAPSVVDSGLELRLTAGQLYLINGTNTFKVRATINDGQWHHLVIQGANSDALGVTDSRMSWINVDGKRVLSRDGGWGGGAIMLPRSIMAKTTIANNAVTGATSFLAGDVRDFITRMNYYMDGDLAVKLYYEWSNAMIVEPDVVTISLTAPKPFSVKGNVKKMLAIYGLPQKSDTRNVPYFTYQSVLSGMAIAHFNVAYNGSTLPVDFSPHADYGTQNSVQYGKPAVFKMGDYLVYPVDITGQANRSVDGVLNGEYDFTQGTGSLVDDETGYIRFLNLQEDLNDITDFDAVTVVNYPAETQGELWGEAVNEQYMPGYPKGTITASYWDRVRDGLRDSLLEAAYNGTSLWMPEIGMAKHLGFIGDFDHHSEGRYQTNSGVDNWGANALQKVDTGLQYANTTTGGLVPGIPGSTRPAPIAGTINLAGYWIDSKHMRNGDTGDSFAVPASPDLMVPSTGFDYLSDFQANYFRRIVEVEPGLTDIPSWEYGDRIYRNSTDPFDMSNNGYAYDVVDKTGGLHPGDLTRTSIYESYTGRETWQFVPYQRFGVLSARPDGIAGKVIAREMDWYWGPRGQRVDNPFKDNAITIAAERGTVVRGRAIRGRAFMDFMDSDLHQTTLSEDANKLQYGGNPTKFPASTWSFDSRRVRAIALQLTRTILTFSQGQFISKTAAVNYFNFGDGPGTIEHPYVSMNQRGLKWLAATPLTSANDAIVYSPAVSLTVTMPTAQFTAEREVVAPVLGAMRLDVEVRDASNYRGNDVQEKALPMSLSLEMHGTGAVVSAPVATLSLTMPNVLVDAGGDKIAVYLDGDRTVTLFLKEDN